MTTEDINKIVNYFGNKTPIVAMEECGELIQAISKMERDELAKCPGVNNSIKDNLIEELADVYICIEMLGDYYGISSDVFWSMVEQKIQRGIERAEFKEKIRRNE